MKILGLKEHKCLTNFHSLSLFTIFLLRGHIASALTVQGQVTISQRIKNIFSIQRSSITSVVSNNPLNVLQIMKGSCYFFSCNIFIRAKYIHFFQPLLILSGVHVWKHSPLQVICLYFSSPEHSIGSLVEFEIGQICVMGFTPFRRFSISDPIHQILIVLQIPMKTDIFSNTAKCPIWRIDFTSVKKFW